MKRIKIVLNALAITVAIAGALATRFYSQVEKQPQFIPANNTYIPAGEYGTDYNCYDSNGVCTFYQPNPLKNPTQYVPCRKGQFQPIPK